MITLTLGFILFTSFIIAQFYDCEIIIYQIKGVMLGALYNDDEFDDDDLDDDDRDDDRNVTHRLPPWGSRSRGNGNARL